MRATVMSGHTMEDTGMPPNLVEDSRRVAEANAREDAHDQRDGITDAITEFAINLLDGVAEGFDQPHTRYRTYSGRDVARILGTVKDRI